MSVNPNSLNILIYFIEEIGHVGWYFAFVRRLHLFTIPFAVARHTAEKISSSTLLFVAATVFHLLGLDLGISNLISSLVLELPNSRKQELEGGYPWLRRLCLFLNH